MASMYLRKTFNPKLLPGIATKVYKTAREIGAEIIVGRGLSGTIVASAIGAMYEFPFAIVRKDGESSHAEHTLEISEPEYDDRYVCNKWGNWCIVDDFIVSGRTVEEIAKEIKSQYWIFTGDCVGIILYNVGGQVSDSHWIETLERSVPIYRVGKR